jgi:D-alanyl-D-alanine carboxypeptidase
MAVKSVIDIDLNDAAWKRFAASWNMFQKQLAGKPLAEFNRGLAQAAATQGTAAQRMTAQIKVQISLMKEEERTLTRQISVWNRLSDAARSFSDHVRNSLGSLARAVPFGTALAGILGVGSLWGLDRLAGTVGAGRRAAGGLGITYGEQRAFRLNFERLVDAPGFLASVGEAMRTAQGRTALYGAGLRESDITGKDTAQVAAQLLPALKRIADRTPENLLGNVIGALHLGELGVGIQDLVRLRGTSQTELGGMVSSYRRDVRGLGLQSDTQRAWQDFYVQMERAGETIETVFIKKLTPLIPGLTHMSDSIIKAIESFLGPSDKINEGMKKFGEGIEWLAGYVGSEEFQEKIKNFAIGISQLADSTVSALRFLGVISTPAEKPLVPGYLLREPKLPGSLKLGAAAPASGLNYELAAKLHALRAAAGRDIGDTGEITSGFRTYEQQAKLYANRANNPYPVNPPGFSQHEKGMAADVSGSQKFMDYVHAHAAEYGLTFPHANDPVHVQLANPRVDIRIENPAGANVFTTTNSVGQAP